MAGALDLFTKASSDWFLTNVGNPTLVQQEGWPAIASGGHVLVSAPTGTGKTLCAFMVFIDKLMEQGRRGELPAELQLLYISPLKSLGNDIRENLRKPLEGISRDSGAPRITAMIRTGDTSEAERRSMLKHPPHILITTPESLFLLLTGKGGREMLKTVNAVVIDELHAIIGTKRGAHLMLSLSRLDELCGKRVQRIGLSATIEPLSLAADYLGSPDTAEIVAPKMKKDVDIKVTTPIDDMRILPEGSIWPELARGIFDKCNEARTAIAFVESRAQAERVAHGVNLLGGDGFALTHHGCVSKEQRLLAEQRLRAGEVRLLCATSSMELGIDVGEIDIVMQIGAPRTIMSAMQRLGRAGHNPGRTSVMRVYPRTAAEGLTCGLTAAVALEGGIERLSPPRGCLDVLAQHLVSMAASGGFMVDDVVSVVRNAYNFKDVTQEEITGILSMLAGDYEHDMDRPARPRILYDRVNRVVTGDAYSRMLAVSAGGTIPDRGWFAVRLPDGTKLGEVDEEFVFEQRVGDKFLLGAFAWKIADIGRDSVTVTATTVDGAQPPFWKGDWFGRPYQTGLAFGRLMRRLAEAGAGGVRERLKEMRLDETCAANTARVVVHQLESTGCLPDDRTIIAEHFKDISGENQLMIHSVFGGRVNAALAVLLKEQALLETGLDIYMYHDDDGVLLHPFSGGDPLPEGLLKRIRPEFARPVLMARLPATPLFNMAFRYNASRALMMGVRQGRRLPLWVQRLRGAQALSDAALHDEHPLMAETRRECLEDFWDLDALEEVLEGIQSGNISVIEMQVAEPSPLSLPLRRAVEAEQVYNYFPTPSNAYKASSAPVSMDANGIAPEPGLLKSFTRARRPDDEEQAHSVLMTEGDMAAGEADVPITWLESLARRGRAMYIEPGLWISAEHSGAYHAAEEGDAEAASRIIRRCLRYRGAQTAESLSRRYFWDEQLCQSALDSLVELGAAQILSGEYHHTDNVDRARRETINMRRAQAVTFPQERYAALICRMARQQGEPRRQLLRAIEQLRCEGISPRLWEGVILPARVTGYRPEMMDEMLARGDYFWRLTAGEKPELAFYSQEDIDWDAPYLSESAELTGEVARVAVELKRRGASFAQSLGQAGAQPVDALMWLAENGFARADSFLPVRRWLDSDKKDSLSLKVKIKSRVTALVSGRWELCRPEAERGIEAEIERAFDRAVVLCRETCGRLNWPLALETLRVWEYTGRVRRGYFVKGLSGAQFIRDSDYASATAALDRPQADVFWLNAADPAQIWGKSLSHIEERGFMNVPGTAVALKAGVPIAVFERQGALLRVFDAESMGDALKAFARDFELNRVFPQNDRVSVSAYPESAKDALTAAGFRRQALDYVFYKRHI